MTRHTRKTRIKSARELLELRRFSQPDAVIGLTRPEHDVHISLLKETHLKSHQELFLPECSPREGEFVGERKLTGNPQSYSSLRLHHIGSAAPCVHSHPRSVGEHARDFVTAYVSTARPLVGLNLPYCRSGRRHCSAVIWRHTATDWSTVHGAGGLISTSGKAPLCSILRQPDASKDAIHFQSFVTKFIRSTKYGI
jgi:hypothetical protein